MANITVMDNLKREVIPGINLFELILFSFSTIIGITLFILTITLWSDSENQNTISNLIALIDIPIGVIAATFLAKRSKLAPLLLSVGALLYGSANFIAGQFALGFVNFIFTPIIYMVAFIWIWPKQEVDGEVKTKKFNLTTGLIISGLAIGIAVVFGVVMTLVNGIGYDNTTMPAWLITFSTWFDSFAAALMLMAVITSVLRFREAWYFYFTSNVLKIILFTSLIIYGDLASLELLVLAITYFINSIFALVIWRESEVVNISKT